MRSIGDITARHFANRPEYQAEFEKRMKEVLNYPPIRDFIESHSNQITAEMIENSYSKLNEMMVDDQAIARGESGQNPGFAPQLALNGNFIDVIYVETEAHKKEQAEQKQASLLDNRMMSRDVRQASLDKFYRDSPIRQRLFAEVSLFVKDYQEAPYETKGLYLYGNFGVGKTYLLGALANYLVRLGKTVTMVHYPSFVLEVKQLITSGQVGPALNRVKAVDILILDDIGAESNTQWVRDEVLNTLLEYRMKESLATFFTSNFSMAQLMQHLGQTKEGKEAGKAMRIMERIRFLSREIEFQGENLRQKEREQLDGQ